MIEEEDQQERQEEEEEVERQLRCQIETNLKLASHLIHQHHILLNLHQATQTHLLQLHGLERAWKMKQLEMDTVLEPFSPKSLYLRLLAALADQARLCDVLEASFFSFDHRRRLHRRRLHRHRRRRRRHRVAGDIRTREIQQDEEEKDEDEEEEEGEEGDEEEEDDDDDETLVVEDEEGEDDSSSSSGGAGAGTGAGSGARAIKRESHQLIDFISSYRRARHLYHLRREEKNRWDEGRVGGWR